MKIRVPAAPKRAVAGVVEALDGWVQALVVVVTLIMFTIAWPTLPLTHEVPSSLLPLLAALEVAPLLLVRRMPFAGWAASLALALVVDASVDRLPAAPMPWTVVHFLVILALLLAVGARSSYREVAITAGTTFVVFLLLMPDGLRGWAWGQAAFVALGLFLRWLVLSRRELAAVSLVSADERSRRAAAEERALIARELHDVVAHHMSMIVVQAQSAPYRLEVSDEVRGEFVSIETSARSALTEVRTVLGVLRREDDEGVTAPVPGAGDLEDLLSSGRDAGLPVSWRVDPQVPEKVSASTGLAIYRILQESLANASRHAPGATVQVDVTVEGEVVAVRVANGPATVPSLIRPSDGSGGAGVPGMRTRAEAAGGSLNASPTPEEGFLVQARMPAVQSAAAATAPA